MTGVRERESAKWRRRESAPPSVSGGGNAGDDGVGLEPWLPVARIFAALSRVREAIPLAMGYPARPILGRIHGVPSEGAAFKNRQAARNKRKNFIDKT